MHRALRPHALILAAFGLLLGACAPCPQTAVETPHAAPAAVSVVEALLPAPKPPADVVDLLPAVAIDLIVEFEINGPAYYEKRLQAPVWPGHASGVTVGIGYDLGHQLAAVIDLDWRAHSERGRLVEQAGIKGEAAKARIAALRDVRVTYLQAREVFDRATIVSYYRQMRRAFPGAEHLHPIAQGALTSLVYNRGASMRGHSRRHMRVIRDQCVPAANYRCIATELREMVVVWKGSTIERGMHRRRYAEAALLERIA